MDQDKFNEYVTNRYEEEIAWYEKRAAYYKQWYNACQWAVLILSASLPVLTLLLNDDKGGDYKFLIAFMGIILAVGTAALKTFKFQENWLNYRTTAETLKKEKYFYSARIAGYEKSDNREALFIKRVESLISRENTIWFDTQKKQEPEPEPKKGS